MTSGSILFRLQNWYLSQCDEDWEHQNGVHIDTLDNPGWMMSVDIAETELEEKSFDFTKIERSEHDWIIARVDKKKFEIDCGPENLEEAMTIFLDWAELE